MKNIIIPIVLSTVVITGCSQSVPTCGDDQTIGLVTEFSAKKAKDELGEYRVKNLSYTIGAIRTIDTNSKNGSYQCAAQLVINNDATAQSNEIPITYTAQMTDNGEEFFVDVKGL